MNAEQPPVRTLWENVDGFFRRFHARHGEHMRCSAGCAACCHAEIGVFAVEAVEIVTWFHDLDDDTRNQIRRLWESADTSPAPDASGNVHAPCAFLAGSMCTVYPVRPVICRTQGLALLFRTPGSLDGSGEPATTIDVCPLNFREQGSFPASGECLDLDRLNTLLSVAAGHPRPGPHLARIESVLESSGRISLRSLRAICEASGAARLARDPDAG